VSSLSVEPVGADCQHQPGSLVLAAGEAAMASSASTFWRRIQIDIAERFTAKGGLKGAAPFAGAEWVTRVSGCAIAWSARWQRSTVRSRISTSDNSHAIVIGRVLDLQLSSRTAGAGLLAWPVWSRSTMTRTPVRLAEVSVPGPRTVSFERLRPPLEMAAMAPGARER